MVMMDEALKNQDINSIKNIYLKEFKNRYTGFLGVTCHDFPEHLINQYIKITTADLESKSQ